MKWGNAFVHILSFKQAEKGEQKVLLQWKKLRNYATFRNHCNSWAVSFGFCERANTLFTARRVKDTSTLVHLAFWIKDQCVEIQYDILRLNAIYSIYSVIMPHYQNVLIKSIFIDQPFSPLWLNASPNVTESHICKNKKIIKNMGWKCNVMQWSKQRV